MHPVSFFKCLRMRTTLPSVGQSALGTLILVLPAWPAQPSCANPNFVVDTFIVRWNEHASKGNLGRSWTLPAYNGLGFLRQNLEAQGVLLTLRIDKNRCINRVDIKSRRSDASGYAALVAWSSVIVATNPFLPKEQRKTVFSALRLDTPDAGGSYTVNRVTYAFVENTEVNDFSAT